MKNSSPGERPQADTSPPESLTAVLEQSEHVEELVKESAEELAKVNAVLKKEVEANDPSPAVERALALPFTVRLRDLPLELTVKASIGIAAFPKDGTTVDTLVISADMAMYQAKRNASGCAFAS